MATSRKNEAPTLLVELGTEELPPKSLAALGKAFASSIYAYLGSCELLESEPGKGDPGYEWFATPRRLAVSVPGVLRVQPPRTVERRGPALSAAFDDDGKPTRAASGFAGSCGVTVEELESIETPRGEWLVFREKQKGQSLSSLLAEGLEAAVRRLPIRKRMRWGSGEAEFVRPVHWLLVMHGDRQVKTSVLEVRSGKHSQGHRFMSDGAIPVATADDYASALRSSGKVIASFSDRQEMITAEIDKLADSVKGRAPLDQGLLDEVTGLVEWPTGVLGDFDKEFLGVPQECLVSAMRDHQKYFHLTTAKGKLLPHFITISNIRSKSPARVRSGNERVLRARLSDARFFWETDLRTPLEDRRPQLEDVLFHVQLGSILDKTRRLEQLAIVIADQIGADVRHAGRAAVLSKADLVSGMVGEFPELQGTMGRYYAENDNEDPQVSAAIERHYLPRFAGDDIATDPVSQAVALADRVDSLVGIFSTGEEPTGEKDPYALRRAALGVLRTIVEGELDLDLGQLMVSSAASYKDTNGISIGQEVLDTVLDFILERLLSSYVSSGHPVDEVRAVLACRPLNPLEFHQRLQALAKFRALPEAVDLSAANKRISNILKKADSASTGAVNADLLDEAAEKGLLREIDKLEGRVEKHFSAREFEPGLKLLAGLRDPVDRFFDEVMVMTEDVAVQNNRLSLLRKVQQMFLQVADLTELQTPAGKSSS